MPHSQTDALAPLFLSWSGSEVVYKKCDANICASIANLALVWKKNGKTPLNISFPVKFVEYSSEVIFRPRDRVQDYSKCAFLHMYFIDAETVDDYRANVRHEVSEWFSTVNQVDFTQWIIVFDSTKSKENKTRGQVLERIKSDFSKYISRLVEIYDSSGASMTSLTAAVQGNVQTAIDCFITFQEATLLTSRNRYRNPTWSLVDYLNQHFMILRFYQRLNILEHVLEQLDDLSKMVDTWMNLNVSGGKRPFWLESLGCDPFKEKLPLLCHLVNIARIPSELNIIELRSLIVSRQITLVLKIYESKPKPSPEEVVDGPGYRTDFASLTLRYASLALDRMCVDLKILEPKYKPERFHAWAALYTTETLGSTLKLCAELGDMESPQFLGNLLMARTTSINWLKDFTGGDLLPILEATKTRLANGEPTDAIDMLLDGLKDQDSYMNLAEEDHELSERLLKQFNWKRHARFISAQLSRLQWNTERSEDSLPYLFKFISSVIADRKSIKLVEKLMNNIVEKLKKSEKYMDKIIDYTALLMLHDSNPENKIAKQKLLFKLINDYEESSSIIKVNDSPSPLEWLQSPIKIVRAVVDSPYISGIPGETIQLILDIESKFPTYLSGSDVDISLVFRPLTPALLDELKGSSGPVFECSFNRVEKVNRFACLTKGSFLSRKHQDATYNELETSGIFVFEQMKFEKLLPGRNRVVLNGTAVNPGLYVVDRVQLRLRKKSLYVVKWRSRNTLPVRNGLPDILCAIQSKQPSVILLDQSRKRMLRFNFTFRLETLLSGMAQKITLEVSSGSTTTVIGDEGSDLKVWVDGSSKLQLFNPSDKVWTPKATVSMGRIDKEAKRTIEVVLYKPIDGENAPEQIEVEWMSLRWSMKVEFEPLFIVQSRTSLMGDGRMVELQLTRPHGVGNTFNVIPESASMESATLLNANLNNDVIVPNSEYCLIFTISNETTALTVAKFNYKIVNRIEGVDSVDEIVKSRSYMLEDTVTLVQEKAEYELCAQLCSEQPKAILLRAGLPCNLVVSLRSLTNRVETVVIALESDDKYWQIEQKYKLLFVKESGLGQTSFAIVPKMIGFLPYPGIFVHSCSAQTDSSQVIGEQTDFGARRSAFLRTMGRQVHVLSAFAQSKQGSSSSLELPKQSLRSSAAKRLQKLLA
ncbi:hypothetical protein L596_029601 [Steinernema carpocapsae]|uniref:TRAPPC10/Trs130 N-terminal domain-containing protein n=1 Tax=Steinernema carpocapsae TaxID=34508 RepID=A0A4V5ZXJ7_STECR|nr:hypothetical protein L596_029601 [Steinernema carpocapsae]